MNAQVCVSCGAVTVDQNTLQRLAGGGTPHAPAGPQPVPIEATPPAVRRDLQLREEPRLTGAVLRGHPSGDPSLSTMSDATFERQLSTLRQARRRRTLVVTALAAIAALVVLLAIPISYVVFRGVQSFQTSGTRPAAAGSGLVVVENSEPPPPPEPAPTAATVAEPVPAPAPAPTPASPSPAPPTAPSADTWVRRGWTAVETDPSAAAGLFRKALDLRPSHADANYGYGYSLLKLGNPVGARPYLCVALKGGDLEVTRDVRSLLAQNGLTCE